MNEFCTQDHENFFDYLKDKIFFIVSFLVILSFATLVSFFDRTNRLLESNILYIIIVSIMIFVVFLLIDFYMHYRYLKMLIDLISKNRDDWGIKLPEPPDSIDRYYYELLKRLYGEKIDELEAYRLKKVEDIDFLTSWIHQIKNPISVAKLIIESNNKDSEMLRSIEEEIDKIDDYVQKVLHFSRINDFSQDYIIEEVDLKKIMNERIKRFSQYFISKKVKLKLADLNYKIKTDKKSLGFIIDQIISNALKYTTINGTIDIFSEKSENEIVLNIKDNGIGIKKEDIGRVFKKTFTGGAGRLLYSSTGFGLYLSKKLAGKLNHSIKIRSKFKEGTTVSIHFPLNASYYDISKV